LGQMLDDAQAHIGKMVEHLMASMGGEAEEIYKVGLQATPLLETISEVVIAWLMLRQAEVALPKVDEDPFYEGKVAAARWIVRDVSSRVSDRARRAHSEDVALMDLPFDAFWTADDTLLCVSGPILHILRTCHRAPSSSS